ncbi:metallophosphoesterase [Devosia nitrariae]|uniref:Phosphatase n=1 Tax=Devosia nitrariae TaxID=2071872 RepID=A0ABQ5W0I4_9HYPH|nr:metallophosphoesterase [Devosia nitrariae]GLQ53574.1 phosphatase [Devosia nitrariae]
MRAWVFSDLHVDAAPYELPPTPPDIDCIIIAGDVADGHHLSARWLRHHVVPRGLPVMYVLGNHDFFGHDISDDHSDLYARIGVELLHPGRPVVEIAGVRIIGCTLWTDYDVNGDVELARAWARESMPDLQSIDLGLRRVGTRDLLDLHRQHLGMLAGLLTEFEIQPPTIVVTHHAPHPKSLRSPHFIDDSDASFASDLSHLITVTEPAVWIHGHVHHSRDYYIGATRVVCNPRGYAVVDSGGMRIENQGFEPGKVIEL